MIMSETFIIGNRELFETEKSSDDMNMISEVHNDINVLDSADMSDMPSYASLKTGYEIAGGLVDDIVLKKYLYKLSDMEIVPLDDRFKQISDIRLFKITEMVYQKNEYSTYKFASVFSAVQNLNCGIFIIADSDGARTDFYMGVRSLDDERTTKSLKDTLKNALKGQFPGVKTEDLLDTQAEEFLRNIKSDNIASVSCVANNKDDDFKDNETFIQGLEKFAVAMQGKRYTAVILAKGISPEQLDEIKHEYETIYTQMSPFTDMQLSYGTNTAINISDALSNGTTTGTSYTESSSSTLTKGKNISTTEGTTESVSKMDGFGAMLKMAGGAIVAGAGIAAIPFTGGASASVAAIGLGALGAFGGSIASYSPETESRGSSHSETTGTSESISEGTTVSDGRTESESFTSTRTTGSTEGRSDNMQVTMKNKTLINTLDKIDMQLKRIDECEEVGMLECAAYFLADSCETVEMAAGTYKALMKGDRSGVETSAVNLWGSNKAAKTQRLREYITNMIHPVFIYENDRMRVPVTASSLVSSNELAIQMGLPRKSVCGFPVIEHADFGKEVVSYSGKNSDRSIELGNIFSMGTETEIPVKLDIDSLTMHTFITGSTGSGKSNAVYHILDRIYRKYDIPFLVIEPAKGEYKNVFGQYSDVYVYGTNPLKAPMLKIDPFSFPEDIHVLEHLDRLVEIFNVCWPMYAAMPAILKESIEKSYVDAGWDLITSVNGNGRIFPDFTDILEHIEAVINDSKYSSESKSDYAGALLTRVRSLTTGLNGSIFCNDALADEELFDKNVIIDLSRTGSTETKSLIMGILIMKLNEYRMASGKVNSGLSHITIMEEAHNLLKRTSTEQSNESSNISGKSVEMIANSIAEMRTYGEGFIIADQAPGLLDMSVIRNTNTKIILRLPDRSDRELTGYSASLDEEQIDELAKLKRGVAAVYQNDWVEPVLAQISKCVIDEIPYKYDGKIESYNSEEIKTQIVNFIIQGRVAEKLDFSIEKIKNGLENLNISSANRKFIKDQVVQFEKAGSISLWKNKNFSILAKKIVSILGIEAMVEKCVLNASDEAELTERLEAVINKVQPRSSELKRIALMHCCVKDVCNKDGFDEGRLLENLWMKHMREKGVR